MVRQWLLEDVLNIYFLGSSSDVHFYVSVILGYNCKWQPTISRMYAFKLLAIRGSPEKNAAFPDLVSNIFTV